MKLFLQSVACGVLITGLLLLITLEIKSEVWGCILLWQACLLDAIRSHPAEREFPITAIIGIFLGVPIYSFLSYIVLKVSLRNRN
jgi:hypothetical protein